MKLKNYYQTYGISKDFFLDNECEEKLGKIHQKLFLENYPSEGKSKAEVMQFIDINDGYAILSEIEIKEIYDDFLELQSNFVLSNLSKKDKTKLLKLINIIKEKRIQTQRIISGVNTEFTLHINSFELFLLPYFPYSDDTLLTDVTTGIAEFNIDLGDVSETGFSFLGDLFTIDI